MANNKRMVYIWDENLEFYDQLGNKSDIINRLLKKHMAETIRPQDDGVTHPDPRMQYVREQQLAREARDRRSE